MSIVIRDVQAQDLQAILALNNTASTSILPLEMPRLQHFYKTADYFRIAEHDGVLAGFLIGFSSQSTHDSANFRWFCAHSDDFLYIDRIVIARHLRGAGLGRVLYADVQSYAELYHAQLTCEVFLDDNSDRVLLFHGSFGFQEVGQYLQASNVRAAMLSKTLCSYPWVKAHYNGQLPHVPWLRKKRILQPANASQHVQ